MDNSITSNRIISASPKGDATTINWLHILVFAPTLLTLSIYSILNRNPLALPNENPYKDLVISRALLGIIGVIIVIYHGFKLFETGSGLYLFHIVVGLVLIGTSLIPTFEGYGLVATIGVVAIVYHSYLLVLKHQ